MKLSAHGKVFLAGEYAVLDGGAALVMGIDRDLHATAEPADGCQIVRGGLLWDGGPAPEELRFAARAAQICGMPKVRLVYENDLPKGLGSSAAATVIAVRAMGGDPLTYGVAAHWAEQGGSGSGADVAASALGGVLEVRSRIPWKTVEEAMSNPARPLEIRSLRVPADLRLLLADTGRPADTRQLVRAVAGADTRPLADAARSLRDALESASREQALEAVRDAEAAMSALGVSTDELKRICALAASAGAAGKPSGAGGGDYAVIFCFGDEMRDRAEAAISPHFKVMRVSPA